MKKNVAIVAHKFLPQMDDDLVLYLNQKKYNILHINHSFPDSRDRRSFLTVYKNGNKLKEKRTLDYIFLLDIFVYLKEFVFTFAWLVSRNKKTDLYIGMDGLCTFFGLILKLIGRCKRVVYWSVDFVPFNRFPSNWKNYIYHRINMFVCSHADEVWDLSPRMKEGRRKYLYFNNTSYKSHKIVQNGMWLNRMKPISYSKSEKTTLVFMGHLMKKQGVDVVIKKIPEILKYIPNFKFKIIGDGNYRKVLEKLSKSKSVDQYCSFLGRLNNIDLENEISKSCVAIAPYLVTKDSYTYYADSGKVKTYLACGVPILLTDISWNTKEIITNKCGLVIKDDGSDLVKKMLYIMKPETNNKFRLNSIEYSTNFDFNKIFANLNI